MLSGGFVHNRNVYDLKRPKMIFQLQYHDIHKNGNNNNNYNKTEIERNYQRLDALSMF